MNKNTMRGKIRLLVEVNCMHNFKANDPRKKDEIAREIIGAIKRIPLHMTVVQIKRGK